MSERFFPGVSEESLRAEVRAQEAAAAAAAEKKREKRIKDIIGDAGLGAFFRRSLAIMAGAYVTAYLVASLIWLNYECCERVDKQYGKLIGIKQPVPYREMMRESVDGTYVSRAGTYVFSDGQSIRRDENKYAAWIKFFCGLGGLVGVVLGYQAMQKRRDEVKDLSLILKSIRNGKGSYDIGKADIVRNKRVIRRITQDDVAYFNNILNKKPDISTKLAVAILDAYLRKHPQGWPQVKAAFDRGIPEELIKKYEPRQR